MSKLVVANTSAQTLTVSNSAWLAIANVVSVMTGSVSNTNLELAVTQMLANGLRNYKDHRLSHGEATTAGLTHTYIETVLKPNSE